MNPAGLNPRKIATILFDEYHSESWSVSNQRAVEIQPDRLANSSYQVAADALAAREFVIERNINSQIDSKVLQGKDVLVLLHPCGQEWEATTSSNSPKLSTDEIETVHDFVENGGGLLIVSEYENAKYGNNLNDLVSEFGITIDNTTVTDRVGGVNEEKTHILAALDVGKENLLIGVNKACFYRAGSCSVKSPAKILVSASATAKPKHAGLVAVAEYGRGRIVVVNDSDLFGDECIGKFDHLQLWLNLCYWMSEPAFDQGKLIVSRGGSGQPLPEWTQLKSIVDALRAFHGQKRQPDNSYKVETTKPEEIKTLVAQIITCITTLKKSFSVDTEYLDQVVEDFKTWERSGFGKPNFVKSLTAFSPQTCRKENIEHLVVFPLYTPNNSLDIHFEALVIRVPWYDWLAEMERTEFHNAKFVPGLLVDFTKGYDSECAVLFPETVSIDGPAPNNFGVIFCDREAKRYQKCVRSCAHIVHLNTPPDLVCFLKSLDLTTDMFVAWDLVHDTSHSMGPLPFDPFMIRQLAPYWMYALEELRVDLRSVKAGIKMVSEGVPFGKTIAYGVLFDRVFRFAITGSRVKNYDGLAGQLLFAVLDEKQALMWEDNRLTVFWDRVFNAMSELSKELEELYRKGARQSEVRRFREGHKFISKYLEPAISSKWQNAESIDLHEDKKKPWIALALEDEFPIGGFHFLLKKKYDAANALDS